MSYVLGNLAARYLDAGALDKAEELYHRALTIREAALGPDDPRVSNILASLGYVKYQRRDFAGAKELFIRSQTIRQAAFGPEHPDVGDSFRDMGRTYLKMGDTDQARSSIDQALHIQKRAVNTLVDGMSEREALALLRHGRLSLDEFLIAFDGLDDTARAYDELLNWKGTVRRSLSHRRHVLATSNDPAIKANLTELGRTKRKIAQLTMAPYDAQQMASRQQQIASLTATKESLERELGRQQGPVNHDEPDKTNGEALRAFLATQRGTVVVDLLRYQRDDEQHYLAFVLSGRGSVRRVELGLANELDTLVEQYRGLLGSADAFVSRIDEAGDRVREALWDPLKLKKAKRVIVTPDGGLTGLSLAGLPHSNGGYLLEHHQFSYLDSTTDLLNKRVATPAQRVLLVGGIDFDKGPQRDGFTGLVASRGAPCVDDHFDPLVGAEKEISDIAALFAEQGQPVEQLGGREATEGAVRGAASGAGIIHLATHGFFAANRCRSALGGDVGFNPMVLSGVVLAGANTRGDRQEDGIWTAEEVSSLDLTGTQLVVLSACETGLGEVQSGEGVLGLRRSFALAGTKNLIMSLWRVEDEATRHLMTDLYQELLRNGKSPVEALHRAQLQALERNRTESGHGEPASWAAFIAAGP
ncbi:MAG: CHAT domain-containing protein [Proteobacteria bacterium]|nr:CHAT domain-containing protein [Pseudomonadota bacterium]